MQHSSVKYTLAISSKAVGMHTKEEVSHVAETTRRQKYSGNQKSVTLCFTYLIFFCVKQNSVEVDEICKIQSVTDF
jgi:hypothetical protein